MSETYLQLKTEAEKLNLENDQMRLLGRKNGFFVMFFQGLSNLGKEYRTQNELYEYIEVLYEEYFGERKYSCYRSFQNQYRRYLESLRNN